MDKSIDLFQNCLSPGFLAGYALFALATLMQPPVKEYVFVAFFLTIGGLCVYNYRKCSRHHCKITGVGLLILGTFTFIVTIGEFDINWNWIWAIFTINILLGYGLEFLHKKSHGSVYKGNSG